MTINAVRSILKDALHLGDEIDKLNEESELFGSIPEFDSMAVVAVLTLLEQEFGISIYDDEISSETFQTLGSLVTFVDSKASR